MKVSLIAFIAIIVVEIAILIPSYHGFSKEWKKHETLQVLTAIKTGIFLENISPDNLSSLPTLLEAISSELLIKNWKVTSLSGDEVLAKSTRETSNSPSFNIIWRSEDLNLPVQIQMTIDSTGMRSELNSFLLRIAGLIAIISLFVTIAVSLAIRNTILIPILRLRKRLRLVNENLGNANDHKIEIRQNDEIGEVYQRFNTLLDHTSASFTTSLKNNLALQEEIKERKLTEIELRYSEKHLEKLANFDDLTGLPNRRFAMTRLQQAIQHVTDNNCLGALMFIDLDNFKDINDTLGHSRGDELLQQAALRMINSIRYYERNIHSLDQSSKSGRNNEDIIARIGGDEFMVILPEITIEQAESIATRIQQACNKHFLVKDNEVFVTASIGISTFPADSSNAETCMSHADTAVNAAKHMGRNGHCFYTPDMNSDVARRIDIGQRLRHAVKNNEFELFYQPVVTLADQKIVGVEALLRWTNSELGSVPPDQFIHLAESTGLITPIGEWVFDTACKQCKELELEGFPLKMAINVSPRQFRRHTFKSLVHRVLNKYQLSPAQIELEITEGILVEEDSEIIDEIRELQAEGIRFSIDDFGTGYSSLSYLQRFPVNTLKIDRAFINEIGSEQQDAPLVRTIISMAQNFDLEIIAEGIETREQLEFLDNHGCDQAQGYYFGKPVPFEELKDQLKNIDNQNLTATG